MDAARYLGGQRSEVVGVVGFISVRGEVDAQAKLITAVRFELTGPWPPYDFVQMQLGA